MNQERRDESGRRIGINHVVTLTNSDGIDISVELRDLSRHGFRISHNGNDLMVGEFVTLTSARSTKALGEIKWVNESEAGGVFLDPPDELQ